MLLIETTYGFRTLAFSTSNQLNMIKPYHTIILNTHYNTYIFTYTHTPFTTFSQESSLIRGDFPI
jgi:hypothetical protein